MPHRMFSRVCVIQSTQPSGGKEDVKTYIQLILAQIELLPIKVPFIYFFKDLGEPLCALCIDSYLCETLCLLQ